jgi:hypothetical protein
VPDVNVHGNIPQIPVGSTCTTQAGAPGTVDANGACQPLATTPTGTPVVNGPCTQTSGAAGVYNANLVCVPAPSVTPAVLMGPCQTASGAAGTYNANGVCAPNAAPPTTNALAASGMSTAAKVVVAVAATALIGGLAIAGVHYANTQGDGT